MNVNILVMLSLLALIVAVFLPCETVALVSATNPGFRSIVTQKGLDYGMLLMCVRV